MNDKPRLDQLSARAAYAARKEAARATTSGGDGSPSALEATLSRVSAEVTADAIERRRANEQGHVVTPQKPGPTGHSGRA